MRKYHLVLLRGMALVAVPVTAAFLGAGACDVHDNVINIPNAKINATVDADADIDIQNVAPDQQVPITMNVQNVYLVPPDMTPPPEHVEDAGHIQVYMDDTSTPPILVTAEAMVRVTIPHETKPGKHKLICRLHRHDGMPTNTKTEINIDVKASVTIGGDGGVSTGTGGAGTGGASGTGGAGGASTAPDAGEPETGKDG